MPRHRRRSTICGSDRSPRTAPGTRRAAHDTAGRGSRHDGHLQLGDAAFRLLVVPLVIQLAAWPRELVAAVLDPAHERFVDRLDVVHRPVMQHRGDPDAGKLDDADAVALGYRLVTGVEADVDDHAAVIGGFLVPG